MTVTNVGRFVAWEGCFNARDLGGLGTLPPGALVRADSLDRLTAEGWTTLTAHGVRTVVDLRNDGEREVDHAPRPAGLTTLRIPLDGIEHRDFWDVWWGTPGFGTPAYFRPFLARFPDRVAAVARAVADAPPGGVAFHCGLGRDRTGIIALVLLRLAGASPGEIADDHALSEPRVRARYAAQGRPYDSTESEEYVTGLGTTVHALAREAAHGLDAGAYLRAAGLAPDELARLRARLGAGAGA
ncbi:tyrosine-protein phosphatase [Streptomyces sp. NBC_00091]|uniref:tyrosine-protein phosphatase n=1 Tax=Streptomyces sp. NBC_00091 TaxID=2975648 RepID=UPI0022518D66|nr:tyrosine-protein phosphatase [Streptomyces sp. NBC_00091]MCX5375660.1 tyrosine-protein phosphatase [Streptomyces sp. NBC_00091]